MGNLEANRGRRYGTLRNLRWALLAATACATPAYAQDSAWTGNSADTWLWDDPDNWDSGVPAPDGTATFGASSYYTVAISAPVTVAYLRFLDDPNAYQVDNYGADVTITGGIENLSAQTQEFNNSGTFRLTGGTFGGAVHMSNYGALSFESASAGSLGLDSAGSVVFAGANGGQSTIVNGGTISFAAASSAGSANITNNAFAAEAGFTGGSTAGDATLTNDANGSIIFFEGGSDAGNATIFNRAGRLSFNDTSSAGNATIANIAPAATMRTVIFNNNSTAGSAQIATNGGSVNFYDQSSAGSAAIVAGSAGSVVFQDSSSAGDAVLTAANGGSINFRLSSSGGTARLIVQTSGGARISQLTGTSTTIGSIEGAGGLILGNKELIVGGNGRSTSFSGAISGAGGKITKSGGGTLELAGTNTYSGGTVLDQGGLRLASNAALGTGNLSVAGGTTLGFANGVTNARAVAMQGSADIEVASGDSATQAGNITGAGGLRKIGDGTLTLSGTNSYSGGTTVSAGALRASAAGALSGAVQIDGGTLGLAGADAILSSLAGSGGTIDLGGDLTINQAATTNYAGTVAASGGAPRRLVKAGSGSLTLGGALSGDVTAVLDAGALILNAANSHSATVLAGGTLTIGNGAGPGAALRVEGNGVLQASQAVTVDAAVTVASSTLTVGGNADIRLNGNIGQTGAGAIAKQGMGTLTLAGANTYSGGTRLIEGGLVLANDQALGAAELMMGDATRLVWADGIRTSNAIGIDDGAAVDFEVAGTDRAVHDAEIWGAATVAKTGSGTLVLAASGITGVAFDVRGGTLDVAAALGSDVSVRSGATLTGGGSVGDAQIENGGTLMGMQGQTLGLASLTLGDSAIVVAGLGAPGGAALFDVAGDLTLDGTLDVRDASGFAAGRGIYRLANYGGALIDRGLELGMVPGGVNPAALGVQTAVAGQINLLAYADDLQFWDGADVALHDNGRVDGGAGLWSATAANWTRADGAYNGAMQPMPGYAVFTGAGGTVTLDGQGGALSVTGMQFAGDGYRLTGDALRLDSGDIRVGDGTAAGAAFTATIAADLTGSTSLVKLDLGTLILTGASSLDTTTINAGTLQIGDGGTTGSITADVVNSGVLAFARSDAVTFDAAIFGSGSVRQIGTGVLTLSGGNIYEGGTAIEAGAVRVTNDLALGSGGVTMADGTSLILGDAVTIANALTLNGTALAWTEGAAGGLDGTIGGGGALRKTGAGTLMLGGTNQYTGGTLLDQGALRVVANGGLGSGALTMQAGTMLELVAGLSVGNALVLAGDASLDVASGAANLGGSVSGTAMLTKTGIGALVLAGASPGYSGTLRVATGVVEANGDFGGAAVVASGAGLRGAGRVGATRIEAGGTLFASQGASLTLGSLALDTGAVLDLTLGTPGAGAPLIVAGDLTLDGSIAVHDGGGFGAGVYRLIEYGGALTDNGLDIASGPVAGLRLQTAYAGQVNLLNAAGVALSFWDGGEAGLYDNGAIDGGSGTWHDTGLAWTNADGSLNGALHPQPGFAVFGGSAGTVTADAAAGTLAVTGMQFASDGYRIQGDAIALSGAVGTIRVGDGSGAGIKARIGSVLTGDALLDKTDGGTLILTAANLYTGGTRISDGVLQLGDGGRGGTILGDVDNRGMLAFDRIDAVAFAGTISGTGSVAQRGTGTLIVDHANSYAGGTSLERGTLDLRSASGLGSGALTLSGGTLRLAEGLGLANAVVVNGDAALEAGGAVMTGSLAGSGALVRQGAGTLTFAGNGSGYAGTMTIAEGAFELTGSLSGALVMAAGTTLTGTGEAGATRLADGATLVGTAGRALGFASLALSSGSIVDVALGAAGGAALFDVTGDLTLAGTLRVAGLGGYGLGVYRLFEYGGVLTDNGLALGAVPGNWDSAVQTSIAHQVNLVIALPDPGPAPAIQFWNGAVTAGDGTIHGGPGIWRAGTTNWTDSAGVRSDAWNGNFAVFQNDPGTVTVEGMVATAGMQFVGSGWRVEGGSVALTGSATVRVGDGSVAGARHNATIASALTGSGALVKDDLGTLTLTGANDYAGGTTIAAGTLRIGDGGTTGAVVGPIVNQGSLVFDRSNDLTFAGSITGTGEIRQTGSGRTLLTGDSSAFSGGSFVEHGILVVNGALGGTLSVLAGGRLQGSGAIGSLQIAGMLTPGNSIGTLAVNGNLQLAAGAVYEVEVNAAGQSDRVVASGTATIAGGTVQVLAQAGAYAPSTRYTILTAAGGRSGTFAGVTSNMAFLDPELGYDATNVFLTLRRNDMDFSGVAASANQAGVGASIEPLGTGNPLYRAVLDLSAAQARGAFDALSGEIHASAKGALIDDAALLRRAAIAHGASTEESGLWGQALGSWSHRDGDGNAARIAGSSRGLLMGIEAGLGGAAKLGALGGYSRTTFDIDGRASSGASDNYHAGIYAMLVGGPLVLRAGGTHSWHRLDTRRTVALGGSGGTLRADYDARSWQAFGELAGRAKLGANTVAEPFVGLSRVRLHTDTIKERGGVVALSGAAESFASSFVSAGVRTSVRFSLGNLRGSARGAVGWRHAFEGAVPDARLSLAGASAFTVQGAPLARDAADVDLGADFEVGAKALFGVYYAGRYAANGTAHDAGARLTLRF